MRTLRLLLVAAILLAFTALPVQAETQGITFNDLATIDTTDMVVVPGERWCPQLGTWDEEKLLPGKCLVDLVEGAKPVDRSRPDWDHAMMACRSAGFPLGECEESVGDGEF